MGVSLGQSPWLQRASQDGALGLLKSSVPWSGRGIAWVLMPRRHSQSMGQLDGCHGAFVCCVSRGVCFNWLRQKASRRVQRHRSGCHIYLWQSPKTRSSSVPRGLLPWSASGALDRLMSAWSDAPHSATSIEGCYFPKGPSPKCRGT